MTHTDQNPNHAKARENEIEVLKAISNTGWMTTSLAGSWQWIESSKKVGDKKALDVLTRLLERGLVFKKMTPRGSAAWVLTRLGADIVNSHLEEIGATPWAHHGYEISPLHYQHHIDIVKYLVSKRKQGLAVLGKAQLRSKHIPKALAEFDAMTVEIESNYTVGVLSVSNCADSTQDRIVRLRKLCNELQLIGDPLIIRGLQRKLGHRIEKAK